MKKSKRRQVRAKKARQVAPRPVAGPLRPVVRCPTFKYHKKERTGRGFTIAELKKAGLGRHYARTIGIAVDYRRRNKSVEGLQKNVQRLKEYMSKLILFPKKPAQPKKGDASEEEIKMAVQLKGALMPVKKQLPIVEAYREITDADKKFQAFKAICRARFSVQKKGKGRKIKKDQPKKEKKEKK
jgi:large subunit ribosomal protein L13e